MDTLRSCYVTTMRDSNGTLFKARWYFTDEEPVDFVHVFGSHNHIRDEGMDDEDSGEPGEVWGATRHWVDGSPPIACTCERLGGDANAWLGERVPSAPVFGGCVWPCEFDDAFSKAFLSTTYVNNP